MSMISSILMVALGLYFPFSGLIKILGVPEKTFKTQKKIFFDNYGIDRKGIRSIGFAELFCGISVWLMSGYPQVARTGSVGLIMITLGAIYFHLVYDEEPAPQAAIAMFVLSTAYLLISVYGIDPGT